MQSTALLPESVLNKRDWSRRPKLLLLAGAKHSNAPGERDGMKMGPGDRIEVAGAKHSIAPGERLIIWKFDHTDLIGFFVA